MPEMTQELFSTWLSQARTRYSDQWQHDWEQTKSRILPYVTDMPAALSKGNYYEFPTRGGTDVHEYSGVNVDVQFDTISTGKRGMKYRKFHNEIPLSVDALRDMDTLEMTFAMVQADQKAAAERFLDMCALGVKQTGKNQYTLKKKDDEGYAGGILSTGYGGENGEKEHVLDLSLEGWQDRTGNLIPIDYSTSGTGVSSNYAGTFINRLDAMKTRLMELDAFNGNPEDLVICVSPRVQQLIRSLEISLNRDYGASEMKLGTAVYNPKMQATVIVSNMLPTMDTDTIGGSTINGARMCCAWLKSQIGFCQRSCEYHIKDVNNKVDIDHYSRVRGSAACARLRDDAVMVLPVLEEAI